MEERVRGKLTKEAKEMAKDFLGRELKDGELKLYAYMSYISANTGNIDYDAINREDLNIINKLSEEDHIKYAGDKIIFSKEFYMFIHKMLYETYVMNRKEEFEPVWHLL